MATSQYIYDFITTQTSGGSRNVTQALEGIGLLPTGASTWKGSSKSKELDLLTQQAYAKIDSDPEIAKKLYASFGLNDTGVTNYNTQLSYEQLPSGLKATDYFKRSDLVAFLNEGWQAVAGFSRLYNPKTGQFLKVVPGSGTTATTRAGGTSSIVSPTGKVSTFTSGPTQGVGEAAGTSTPATPAMNPGDVQFTVDGKTYIAPGGDRTKAILVPSTGGTSSPTVPTAPVPAQTAADPNKNYTIDQFGNVVDKSGKHIDLTTFKSLGLNADLIPKTNTAYTGPGASQLETPETPNNELPNENGDTTFTVDGKTYVAPGGDRSKAVLASEAPTATAEAAAVPGGPSLGSADIKELGGQEITKVWREGNDVFGINENGEVGHINLDTFHEMNLNLDLIPQGKNAAIAPLRAVDTEHQAAVQRYDAISNAYGISTTAEDFATNPTQSIQDIIGQVMAMTGVPDIKSQLESQAQEIQELTDEKDTKIRDINDNPWLTEGVRRERIRKEEEKFKDLVDSRIARFSLLQSTYQEALQQARWVAETAIGIYQDQQEAQQNNLEFLLEQQQKLMESQNKLQPGIVGEYQFYVQQEQEAGRQPISFNEYQNLDANRKARASGGGTTSDSDKATTAFFKQLAAWDKKGTREEFIRKLEVSNPDIDPNSIRDYVYYTYQDGYDATP